MCPGVDSASENEYQGIPLGWKAAFALGWRPTTLVVPNVKKIGALTYPEPPWALAACCGRDLFYGREIQYFMQSEKRTLRMC
jgi:hypothetical protein